jgi:flagella basal body P-ring formation protein FlgA
VILWVLAASGITAQQAATETRLRGAIQAAVQARVGGPATVTVDIRTAQLSTGASLDAAVPEPGARFGRPARFKLLAAGRSVGYAVAIVHAEVSHLRVAQPIAAGDVFGADSVREVVGDPGPIAIEPLPLATGVAGNTAVRALVANDVVTSRVVRVPPAVRSGERVVVRVVIGGIEATGVGTALQTGNVGDLIRVVNPDSRRQLRGRVVGKSEVEVQHES